MNRSELKQRAKEGLKKYYWMALLVSVIASMFGVNHNGTSFNVSIPASGAGSSQSSGGDINLAATVMILVVCLIAFLVVWILALAIQSFLSNVVEVGLCSYFIESQSTGTDAGFAKLFYGFSCGNYINVVKVMFMQKIFIFLWSLLLIIPGIIKAYEYAMVPYIVAEDPNIGYKEALERSKDMMNGHKFELWVLQLSFIGWMLLGVLACCIGTIFVLPYQNATYAEYYMELKKRYME